MLWIVHAIEAVTRVPAYRDAALSWAPAIARRVFGPLGVFMGYDFHLAADGPKLIEVNTNTGGAFLNALLAGAQRACCPEVDAALGKSGADDFDAAIIGMFSNEWALQKKASPLNRIAIVDDRPEEQYLYPEFVLAQRCLRKHGIDAIIADAAELRYEDSRLLIGDWPIDLVYNRLVDFALGLPQHSALRAAYIDQAVVVTPSPRVHALFADKRNLALFSDQATLRSWGLAPDLRADLATIPCAVLLTPEHAERLWAGRKTMFFKPAAGHGSKAVYRGDKLTKRVWAEISRGGYVAQELSQPSERTIKLEGSRETRKADIRLYVYDG